MYSVDEKRTEIGKFLGLCYGTNMKAVCTQLIKNGFDDNYIKEVESVIIGNVISAGIVRVIARNSSFNSGVQLESTAYSLNEVCDSEIQAILNGENEIKCGKNLVLYSGNGFMLIIPFYTNTYMRVGEKFGDFKMVDLMTHNGLSDLFSHVHLWITAANVAKRLEITREQKDEYSYPGQQSSIETVDNHFFDDEIVSIILKNYRENENQFDTDKFPNRKCIRVKTATLISSFLNDGNGIITVGDFSGINDGPAFVFGDFIEDCIKNGIKLLSKIVGNAVADCVSQKMGWWPHYAIFKMLEDNELNINNIDYLKINEAYATKVLGCFKFFAEKYNKSVEGLANKSNLHGSGLGLGHQLGAIGERITTTLALIIKSENIKYGVASLWNGGGKGAALLIERIDENVLA